jgi:hypothetical protein
VISPPVALVCERNQRVNSRFRADDYTATVAAITATGTTSRYVLLSAKGHAAIPASTRNDFDFNTIDKHSGCLQQQR